tara:strand:+ start:281 stop:439 length:159 start_codon:yes stop_codon:yes gene_type:complete
VSLLQASGEMMLDRNKTAAMHHLAGDHRDNKRIRWMFSRNMHVFRKTNFNKV